MSRFKVGQKVVCVDDYWLEEGILGPKRGEIVTVIGYEMYDTAPRLIDVEEYKAIAYYDEPCFEEILEDEALEKLVKESFETQFLTIKQ